MSEALNSNNAAVLQDLALLGEVHPLLQQLGSCDGLTDMAGYSDLMAHAKVRDLESLRSFLAVYERDILAAFEFPAIIKAHIRARQNEARELIALDGELAARELPAEFAAASRRAGQGHLQRLRPLRDDRVVQRYLKAVEAGEAAGWHTIVYGVTLAVYSIPLRQGLILYARQTLEGFVRAAARPLQASSAQCKELIDGVCSNIPRLVEHVLQQQLASDSPR